MNHKDTKNASMTWDTKHSTNNWDLPGIGTISLITIDFFPQEKRLITYIENRKRLRLRD